MAIPTMTIVCGIKNLEGKLVPAPLDEQNLTTDWLEEFLFDNNTADAPFTNRMCGYVNLEDDNMLCEVSYEYNNVCYDFPSYNYITKEDVDKFVEELKKFFAEKENLTIMVAWKLEDRIPCIIVSFFFRCEE